MFDALRRRGVWKRHDPSLVLAKFDRLESGFRGFLEEEFGPNLEAVRRDDNTIEDISIAFLADTVVLGVVMKRWASPPPRRLVSVPPLGTRPLRLHCDPRGPANRNRCIAWDGREALRTNAIM